MNAVEADENFEATEWDVPSWRVPDSVGPPLGKASCRKYTDAWLSQFQRFDDELTGNEAVRGAVYANGDLVPASQRRGGVRGDLVRTDDRPRWVGSAPSERLEGTWLYGGPWMEQFGHFLVETLPTLWPSRPNIDGLIFHPFRKRGEVAEWQRQLVRAAGWDQLIRIQSRPLEVERLWVPTRPSVINHRAGPRAISVWDNVASASASASGESRGRRNVFLSRSRLTRERREIPGDDRLDALALELGFEVVHPETLDVMEQVALARDSRVLMGRSGSALHLSAFAPADTHVLEIGDTRSRTRPTWQQLALESARTHRFAFVPFWMDSPGRDLARTRLALIELLAHVDVQHSGPTDLVDSDKPTLNRNVDTPTQVLEQGRQE